MVILHVAACQGILQSLLVAALITNHAKKSLILPQLVRKAAMVSMPVLLFQEILLLSKGAVTTTILAAISLGQCMLGT